MLKIVGFLILFTLAGCSSAPRFTSRNNSLPENKISKPGNSEQTSSFDNPADAKGEPLETTIGVASFYAEPFNGRKTSNGETYNMYELTAAHPWYPFNTIIRVTNLSNNKSTLIRINDRMPKHPSRIIDLSLGTAKQLDMQKDGIAKVKLEILKWGK